MGLSEMVTSERRLEGHVAFREGAFQESEQTGEFVK